MTDAAAFTVEPIPEGAVFTIERPAKLNALTKPVLLAWPRRTWRASCW
jgi:hypothetical protein